MDLTIITPWTDRPWIRPAFDHHARSLLDALCFAGIDVEWIMLGQHIDDLRVVRLPGHATHVGKMRHTGILNARGRALAFVDTDDFHDAHVLTDGVKAIANGFDVVRQKQASVHLPTMRGRAYDDCYPTLQAVVLNATYARTVPYPSEAKCGAAWDCDWEYVLACIRGRSPGQRHAATVRTFDQLGDRRAFHFVGHGANMLGREWYRDENWKAMDFPNGVHEHAERLRACLPTM